MLQLELSLPGAMAEVSPHGTERQALLVAMKGCDRPCPLPAAIQALLAKDAPAPSMAKYTSRVGRARQANQNARNQAHSQATHTHTHTAKSTGTNNNQYTSPLQAEARLESRDVARPRQPPNSTVDRASSCTIKHS